MNTSKYFRKARLAWLLSAIVMGCSTQQESVTVDQDTPIYQRKDENNAALTLIPANSQAFVVKSRKKYQRDKYGTYEGWIVNPEWKKSKSRNITKQSATGTSSSSSSKTVYVKGYTRKDGTYVRPYTRSAPKRR